MSLSSNFRTYLDSFPYETAAKGCIQNRRAELQVNLIDATFAARRAASPEVRDAKAYRTALDERQVLLTLIARAERVLTEKHGMSQDAIEGFMHDA